MVTHILIKYCKNKYTKRSPTFFQITSSQDITNHGNSRFFQNTSKTKHKRFRDSFKLLQKQKTRDPRDCFKYFKSTTRDPRHYFPLALKTGQRILKILSDCLKIKTQGFPRFFQILQKQNTRDQNKS